VVAAIWVQKGVEKQTPKHRIRLLAVGDQAQDLPDRGIDVRK
jgi:hypothetical protein